MQSHSNLVITDRDEMKETEQVYVLIFLFNHF